jgi:hypothetical protein
MAKQLKEIPPVGAAAIRPLRASLHIGSNLWPFQARVAYYVHIRKSLECHN